ncbi:hypothetical protein Tco_0849602 [Tanacetum coccineum]
MSDSDKRKVKARERQTAIVIHKKNRASSSQETLHKGTSCNAIHEWIFDVVHQTEEQQKNQEEKKYEAGTRVGDKNAKGSESPTNKNKQKENKQNDNKQNATVIVYGVEVVEPNTKDNRVTVKEKNCDPIKIAERVKRNSGKHVDIISPVQKKQQEKKPQEKKPEAKEVKHCILKMADSGGDIWIGSENAVHLSKELKRSCGSARLGCGGDSGYNVLATYVTLWAVGICLRNIRGYNMSM